MRWVFCALLVVNVAFFSWQQFVDRDELVGGDGMIGHSESVRSIRLLSELGEQEEVELERRSDADKCDVYGPFFSSVESRSFLRSVKKAGIKGYQQEELVQLKPYFSLYVEPLASVKMAQALVNRLRGYQLNAEIIYEGRLRKGVSLGDFESMNDISRLQKKLSANKISVKTVEKSRDYRQFWVNLSPGSESRLVGQLQDDLIARFPDIFHQQKNCKPIASGE
jgi:hypothetical protein